jgi:hypothetical protein
MLQRIRLGVLLLCVLGFTACKKEDIAEGKDYKTLGTSANDFLSSSNYSSLLLEIDYMPGYAPDATSVTNLVTFLNTFINKPGGISVSQKQVVSSGKTSLTLDDIVKIERTYRSAFTGGSVLAAHILIADAGYSSGDILANSYWNTSTCVFGKTMYNNSGGSGQVTRAQLLTTLLEHEFGHLLGLVDQGTPMINAHKDIGNGAHCNNTHCLMYYAIETDASALNNTIPSLDDNCMADLKANGGK